MKHLPTPGLTLAAALAVCVAASPAFGQRVTFEREFPASAATSLDVTTGRGQIEISTGGTSVTVVGTVTVRLDPTVPADALAIARRVAATPPVEAIGDVVRLREPSGALERRAVTVSYVVRVPKGVRVTAESGSGAVTAHELSSSITVRTGSAAIDLSDITGAVEVTSGSGSVRVERVLGSVRAVTSSSAITAQGLRGAFRARTRSGAVEAAFTGDGDVDVETGSGAVALRQVSGGVTVVTGSARVEADGRPLRPWTVTSGSGSIDVRLDAGAPSTVEAISRSGTVRAEGLTAAAGADKHHARGHVGGGGPLVRLENRSGGVRVTVGAAH